MYTQWLHDIDAPFERLAVQIGLELHTLAYVTSPAAPVVGADLVVELLVLVQPDLGHAIEVPATMRISCYITVPVRCLEMVSMMPLGKRYGWWSRNTWPTREQGMISSVPCAMCHVIIPNRLATNAALPDTERALKVFAA